MILSKRQKTVQKFTNEQTKRIKVFFKKAYTVKSSSTFDFRTIDFRRKKKTTHQIEELMLF